MLLTGENDEPFDFVSHVCTPHDAVGWKRDQYRRSPFVSPPLGYPGDTIQTYPTSKGTSLTQTSIYLQGNHTSNSWSGKCAQSDVWVRCKMTTSIWQRTSSQPN